MNRICGPTKYASDIVGGLTLQQPVRQSQRHAGQRQLPLGSMYFSHKFPAMRREISAHHRAHDLHQESPWQRWIRDLKRVRSMEVSNDLNCWGCDVDAVGGRIACLALARNMRRILSQARSSLGQLSPSMSKYTVVFEARVASTARVVWYVAGGEFHGCRPL